MNDQNHEWRPIKAQPSNVVALRVIGATDRPTRTQDLPLSEGARQFMRLERIDPASAVVIGRLIAQAITKQLRGQR